MAKFFLGVAIAFIGFSAWAQSAQTYFEQGYKMWLSGDNASAERLLRKGLELEPNNALGHYYLGKVIENQNKSPAEALKHYRMVVALSPDSKEGGDALVRITKIEAILEKINGQKQLVLDNLDRILRTQGGQMSSDNSDLAVCVLMDSWQYTYDRNTRDLTSQKFMVALYLRRNGYHYPKRVYSYTAKWVEQRDGWTLVFEADNGAAEPWSDWFAKPVNFNVKIGYYFGKPEFIISPWGLKMDSHSGMTKSACLQ